MNAETNLTLIHVWWRRWMFFAHDAASSSRRISDEDKNRNFECGKMASASSCEPKWAARWRLRFRIDQDKLRGMLLKF